MVDVNDVRLSSGSGNGCSPADLLLPSSHYVCDTHSENLCSVFKTTVSNSTSHFTVQLRTNSKNVSPQMVWLTIQPMLFVFAFLPYITPGRVTQSVGHLTRKSGVLGSIPGLATYFRFSFRFFKKGSRQLLAKVCARSTG